MLFAFESVPYLKIVDMKKLIFTLLVLSITFFVSAQTKNEVPYFKWSNPITYQVSPSPIVTGYGKYSDKLSKENDGKIFYEYDGEYYLIETWADYYYWYTKKYWFNFNKPQVYEFFYYTKNDFEMANYVASNFIGEYYPTKITVSFTGKHVKKNRMSDFSNFAINDEQIRIARNTNVEESNYNRLSSKGTKNISSNRIKNVDYSNFGRSNTTKSSYSTYKSGSTSSLVNRGSYNNAGSQSYKPSTSSQSTTKTIRK